MTREQALAAIEHGAALAEEAIAAGADLLGTGEMGIGNTTAASAITAAITGAPAEAVTGRGTGVDDAGWRRKVAVVARARCWSIAPIRPTASTCSPRSAASRSPGSSGVILAGASHRVPVVLDGFIAGAAALVAVTLAPDARHALFASHRSSEPGHAPGARAPRPDALSRPRHAPGRGDGRRALRRISCARPAAIYSRDGDVQVGRRGRASVSARVVVVAGVASGVGKTIDHARAARGAAPPRARGAVLQGRARLHRSRSARARDRPAVVQPRRLDVRTRARGRHGRAGCAGTPTSPWSRA